MTTRARRASRAAPQPVHKATADREPPITIGTPVWAEKDGPGDWQPGFVGGYAWTHGVQKADHYAIRWAHDDPAAGYVDRRMPAVRRRSIPLLGRDRPRKPSGLPFPKPHNPETQADDDDAGEDAERRRAI